MVAVIFVGGALGASARYGVAQLLHTPAGSFPWATFSTNVSGSLVIGIVLALVLERFPPSRYLRLPWRHLFATGGPLPIHAVSLSLGRLAALLGQVEAAAQQKG